MRKPLENILVLDFTRFFAGPYCAQLLGDYGADVVKIESDKGDEQRLQGPPFVGDQATGFMSVNRNKRSIVVDMKNPAGRDLVLELVKKADVLVENFRTGVADRLGIGYDAVSKLNDRIVYCSISGYGDAGPKAHDPAFDLTVQAYSGFMSLNGVPGGDPVKPAISICDLMTGVSAFSGIEGALLLRERGFKGPQRVKTSLFETISSYLTDSAVEYKLTGYERPALGSFHANIAPYGAFRAKDGYIAVGAGHTHLFKRLCEALGMEELMNREGMLDSGTRSARREEIRVELEKKLQERTVTDWVAFFTENGIPSAPVNSLGTAIDSEQSKAMGMSVTLKHETLGDMKLVGPAVKQPGVTPDEWTAPPMLGQHTDAVLKNILGMLDADIARLKESSAIR